MQIAPPLFPGTPIVFAVNTFAVKLPAFVCVIPLVSIGAAVLLVGGAPVGPAHAKAVT
jgi:hypothetical protein